MIHCREVVELVTDYLDEALPAPRRASLAEHLQRCDGCHTFVEQIRTTTVLARANFTRATES